MQIIDGVITWDVGDIVNEIDVDFHNKIQFKTVTLHQYDYNSTYILATVWDCGNVYTIPTGATVTFNATKPDGKGINNPCKVVNNQIIYQVTEQTTPIDGEFYAEFRIYDTVTNVDLTTTARLKGSPKFKIYVEKSALDNNTVISTDEFNVLTDLITDASFAISNTNTATANAITATNNTNTAIENANLAKDNAIIATTNANNATDLANTKAGLADVSATNANEKATLAQTATDNANQTITNMNNLSQTVTNQENTRQSQEITRQDNETDRQNYYNAYKTLESYNDSTPYIIGNKVTYQGGTYQCILACTGVSPTYNTDNDNWICIAAKGTDGTGIGDMVKNTYDPQNKNTDIYAYTDNKVGDTTQLPTTDKSNVVNSIIEVSEQLASMDKQLGNRKFVDASYFSTLQEAIDFTTSINGVLCIDQINEPTYDIALKCSIIGKYSNSTIICGSFICNNQNNIVLKDFTLNTDYSIAISINNSCQNITLDNLSINPGSNQRSLNPQKILSINATGVTADTPIKNLKIRNCKMWIGGIQLSICDNFLIKDNFIDGNWQNLDEHIHVSFKSRGIISGNTLLNSNSDGMDIFSSGDRCIITENRIIGITTQGIEAKVSLTDDPGNTSSDTLGYVESTIISNNLIKDLRGTLNTSNWCIGINVAYYDSRATKIFDESKHPNNFIISNNIIEDFYTVPYTSGSPIFLGIMFNGSHGVINNNIIRGLKTHVSGVLEWRNSGIYLPVDNGSINSKIIISGNIITSDNTGIYVYNLKDSIISNNIIGKDCKTGVMPRYGILVDGTSGVLDGVNIHNNQFECKTTYVDSNSVTQQIIGHAIYAVNSSVVKDCNISFNKIKNASLTLYTANHSVITQNNITPKVGNAGIDLTSSAYRFGNKIISNVLHSDGTSYAITLQYQKAILISQNTIDNFNTAIYCISYIANTILKDNMQLYDTGDSIYGTCVRLGTTGVDTPSIIQTDNSQVIIA